MPKRITQVEWLRRAIETHGDKYDYSRAKYTGANNKIEIGCALHGSFMQDASSHTAGHGCPSCKGDLIGNLKRGNFDEMIERAAVHHENKYKYPQQPYTNTDSKLKILCPVHGEFEQTMHGHLAGKGCDVCGGKTKLPLSEMLARFKVAHGDTYDYSRVTCEWAAHKVEIICPKHGSFWQSAQDHWSGHGCRACSNNGTSQAESDIRDWLIGRGVVVEQWNRTVIAPREVDLWLPEHNLAIEYHGLYWHTEDRVGNLHAEKRILASGAGIRLIQIYEDEWSEREFAVKQIILNAIGMVSRKVMARKCSVTEVDVGRAREFLNKNHVQGCCASCLNLGLEISGELVAVMTFNKAVSGRGRYSDNTFELARYATNCSVSGGASRLLSAFDKLHVGASVVSYVDHRYFVGKMYEKLGFAHVRTVVDYEYYYQRQRRHKSSFKKSTLAKLMGTRYDAALTERVLTDMIGAKRLMNAGRTTYFR